MGWIGLHTSPNIDPHCTLAWWRGEGKKAKALYVAKSVAAIDIPVDVWVEKTDYFGATNNIEVAVLEENDMLNRMLAIAQPMREGYNAVPHVTAHDNRQCFHFQWVGLHQQREHRYFQLGDAKR